MKLYFTVLIKRNYFTLIFSAKIKSKYTLFLSNQNLILTSIKSAVLPKFLYSQKIKF